MKAGVQVSICLAVSFVAVLCYSAFVPCWKCAEYEKREEPIKRLIEEMYTNRPAVTIVNSFGETFLWR